MRQRKTTVTTLMTMKYTTPKTKTKQRTHVFYIIKCISALIGHIFDNTIETMVLDRLTEKVVIDCSDFVGGAFEFRSIIIVSYYRHDKINNRNIHQQNSPEKNIQKERKKPEKTCRQKKTNEFREKTKRFRTKFLWRSSTIFLCGQRSRTTFQPLMKQKRQQSSQPETNTRPCGRQWNLCYVYCVCWPPLFFIEER